MRQLFYFVVLLVALAGQVSGAVEALGIPLLWAVPAVGALELGGIVVLANADVRRRLGERATASRVLSAAIAGFAVAFNWLAHDNKLLAGFFAGMSLLGYLVWLMHTENQRRDRLRATGDLPPTTPAYEVVGHWIRHPWLTLRAKNLAKADDGLGLYTSLAAARAEKRKEVRTKAIAKVLHRKIRAAVDPTTADIAVAVYDLDEIAVRLADGADYDGLTALIAADLTAAKVGGGSGVPDVSAPAALEAVPADGQPADTDVDRTVDSPPVAAAVVTSTSMAVTSDVTPGRRRIPREKAEMAAQSMWLQNRDIDLDIIADILGVTSRTVRRYLEPVGGPSSAPPAAQVSPAPARMLQAAPAGEAVEVQVWKLRTAVEAALDAHVPVGDPRDTLTLTAWVGDLLELNDTERLTAELFVRTWRRQANERAGLAGEWSTDDEPQSPWAAPSELERQREAADV